jgi:predicted nucleotidyltransferase
MFSACPFRHHEGENGSSRISGSFCDILPTRVLSRAAAAMPLAPTVAERREEILRLAARHGARNVRVFGSAVRGELTPESDVDFLVDLEPNRSLFDLGGLLIDLQDLLGREVDVATEQGIHEYIRSRVLTEAQPL